MSAVSMHSEKVITVVTPSFEKHIVQYAEMIDSLSKHCTDIDKVNVLLIVEQKNQAVFAHLLALYPQISSKIVLTEDVLRDFGASEKPVEFLLRAGKFTFQTLKKFGGLLQADTEWSLVLDSETVFYNDFSMFDVLRDYQEQKYVFYTETEPRGELWTKGDAHQVNCNVEAVLGVPVKNFWFMENFHWFYEKTKVQDLLGNRVGKLFYQVIRNPSYGKFDIFENIMYYAYLYAYHDGEYRFLNFKDVLDKYLPKEISSRFSLEKLPFSLFGNDYLLNIIQPSEIRHLSTLFSAFKIPFLRLEPPFFHTDYLKQLQQLPSFIATISSHHQIWLKKKIAVCVSGEFRHLVHRVPEQQIRFLKSFLSGVECDVFIHGWSEPGEALILHELQPKRYLFEAAPSVDDLVDQIKYQEPLIKPKRDQGSLRMFYSMQKAFELIGEDRNDYDYVVRIRPDIFMERSLKEILISISDDGDLQPDAIYVPSHFHSKGINDQFALGRMDRMSAYFHTFDYAKRNLQSYSFNPEMYLLRSILESGARICLVDAPYALMRHLPMRLGELHHAIELQKHTWWSRSESMPLYTDISAFLTEKLRSMEGIMTGKVKSEMYLPCENGRLIEAKVIDYDPMWHCCALIPMNGLTTALHFNIVDSEMMPSSGPSQVMFLFVEGDDLVLSQWEFSKGKLLNEKMTFSGKDVAAVRKPTRGALDLAWKLNRNLIDGQPMAEKIHVIDCSADEGGQAFLSSSHRHREPGAPHDGIANDIAAFSGQALSIKPALEGRIPSATAVRLLQQMVKPNTIFGKFLVKSFFRALRPEKISLYTLRSGEVQSDCFKKSAGRPIIEPENDSNVLYGPYVNLGPGYYYAEFFFDFVEGASVTIDVRSTERENIAHRTISVTANEPLSIEWKLEHRHSNVEVRLFAHKGFKGGFDCLLIRKNGN